MNYTKNKTIITNKTNKTKRQKKNYTNKYFYTLKGGSNKHINHKTITRENDKFWTNVNLDYINNNKTQGNDNIFFNAEKLTSDTIKFSDIDKAMDTSGIETEISVPKTEENLIAIEKKREENKKKTR